MKKFIILAILLLFCSNTKVYAQSNEEFNVEKQYYDINSRVVINTSDRVIFYSTGKDIWYWWMDMFIEDKFAYCVQPDVLINDVDAHDTDDPLKHLSQEQWEKYSLIALYAEYMYSLSDDINYRYAAQIMIHEDVAPEMGRIKLYNFENGVKKEFFVDEQKSEINSLVEKHHFVPDFTINDTVFKENAEYSFIDTNNVVDNYVVKSSSDNLEVTITNNQLFINTSSIGEASFTLQSKNKIKEQGLLYWYASNDQDLITTTSYQPYTIEYNMNIESKYGSLKLFKVDKDTQQLLSGAKFMLQQVNGDEVIYEKEYVVENGAIQIDSLHLGNYRLFEVEAPNGYKLSNEVFNFTLTNDGEVIELVVENQRVLQQTGNVNISYIAIVISFLLVCSRFFFKKSC